MPTILITGGAGFLGLNIADELIKNNHRIVIVDDLKNSYTCHINNLLKNHTKKVLFFKGDVCNQTFMESIFAKTKPDYVLHLAAKKYVTESIAHPQDYISNNINSLKSVLNCSEKFKVKKFAFSSTSVVYGNMTNEPFSENSPLVGLNPYSQTKIDGENLIRRWHLKTNIPCIIFRFTNPVGANTTYMFGDHSKRKQMQLVPYIVHQALNNKQIVLKGNDFNTPDGTPIRNYLHVSDLARAVCVALEKFYKPFDVYNIGNKKLELSTKQIVTALSKQLNSKVDYCFTKSSSKENAKISCNFEKFNNEFNFKCIFSLNYIINSQIEFEKHVSKSK